MTLNSIIIVALLLVIAVIIAYYIISSNKVAIPTTYTNNFDIDYLTQQVRHSFSTVLKENLRDMNLTQAELAKKEHLRAELKKALKESAYGSRSAKMFIKTYIKDIIQGRELRICQDNIDEVIPFNSPEMLSSHDKHEILIHVYSIRLGFGKEGFVKMLEDYKILDTARERVKSQNAILEITDKMLDYVYKQVMSKEILSYDDKLEIIAERIFEKFKGFGCIDVLLDTSLDGISGGVSGIPSTSFDIFIANRDKYRFNYDSVWCMYKGLTLRLSYLTFGSEGELQRICKNIYKYNNPGNLSEATGFKISVMKNGSRVAVARPPIAESWCFWVRKFDSAPSIAPTKLITDENAFIPISIIEWLIKGCCTTIITGMTGCGKTTLLKSLIRYLDSTYSIRVNEIAAELNLRYTYPDRNIVSFQEGGSVGTQELLDFIKKTDTTVNILGEIATHQAASWFIQNAMIVALLTLATHHAKTLQDLIYSLRNSTLQTGGFTNEKIAEEQVVNVLRINIHCANIKGHRFIERISEVVPIRDRRYPSEKVVDDSMNAMSADTMEYYKRMTDRPSYKENIIMEYDQKDKRYVFVNMPTPELIAEMKTHYTDEEEALFDKVFEELKQYNYKEDQDIA